MVTGMGDTREYPHLPEGFVFGASTAAYQIEGAVDEDGRGPVDLGHLLPHEPGTDRRRQHRRRGLRPLPPVRRGRRADGGARARRLPVLDRLAAGPARRRRAARTRRASTSTTGSSTSCSRAGIAPFATLFHWDLPQALAGRRRLAQPGHRRALRRVRRPRRPTRSATGSTHWITLNEPHVVTIARLRGRHARARQEARCSTRCRPPTTSCSATASRCRRCGAPARASVGIAPTTSPVWAGRRQRRGPGRGAGVRRPLHNRLFTDPVLRRRYPDGLRLRLRCPAR